MGIIYYSFCLIYIVVLLTLFLINKKKYQSSLYVAMYLILAISTMGYLFIAISRNVDEALISTKVSYFGGQFLPPIMILVLSKFIKFKYHNVVLPISIFFGIVFFFITTYCISYTDLYYKSVTLETAFGVSYLIKVYVCQ